MSISMNVQCFVLLITGYFKVLYYTEQNSSGFKVLKLKSASLKFVHSRPLCKINTGYNTRGFTFLDFSPHFFLLLFVLHLYNEISDMYRTVEIVKERSWAMPSLNILIHNKLIKQTAKPVVNVQNMSGLNMLQFQVNYVLSRMKRNS